MPYITIQPVSVLKGYQEFNRIMMDYVLELPKEGDRKNTYGRIKKADSLLMDCFQHAYSYKLFIDVDFDIPDKQWAGLTLYENHLRHSGVTFHKVETAGGFHYLLETATIKHNYNLYLGSLREDFEADSPGQTYEITVSENQAIPIPGTLQYGDFRVKLWQDPPLSMEEYRSLHD
jgi:hypothetical protein